MKCGKLTAKLRDAVQVRFYENGREIKRYKNIEIPDAIKELEFTGFKFDVPGNGPITFKIFFKPGTLPEAWPEARQRKTRTDYVRARYHDLLRIFRRVDRRQLFFVNNFLQIYS